MNYSIKEEILDLLILGHYPMKEVAEMLDITVEEVKTTYETYMEE